MGDPSRMLPGGKGPLPDGRGSVPGGGLQPLPDGRGSVPGGWYGPEMEFEEPGTPLSHYLWVLKRHRWKILAFVASSVVATLIVSSRVTPVYEATATIDIDRR